MIESIQGTLEEFYNTDLRNILILAFTVAFLWLILVLSAIIDEIRYRKYIKRRYKKYDTNTTAHAGTIKTNKANQSTSHTDGKNKL